MLGLTTNLFPNIFHSPYSHTQVVNFKHGKFHSLKKKITSQGHTLSFSHTNNFQHRIPSFLAVVKREIPVGITCGFSC